MTSSTVAEAPSLERVSNALRRPMMIPRSERNFFSEIAESPRIGRSTISSPPSARTLVTSIATPAVMRAARPAPISKPSRPPPNSAYLWPLSLMTLAIASTTGCARPSGASAR